jgi:hypothetical protein
MLSNPTGRLLRDAERSREVHLSYYFYLDALGLYTHGLGDHLAGDLGAGRQGPEQQIPRAGGCPRPPYPGMGLGLVDGAPYVNRAGDGCVLLAGFRL